MSRKGRQNRLSAAAPAASGDTATSFSIAVISRRPIYQRRRDRPQGTSLFLGPLGQPRAGGKNLTSTGVIGGNMRISFSNRVAARAAASLFEQYGFSAKQVDTEVLTDCPTLLAAPAIERSIGLELVERIEL